MTHRATVLTTHRTNAGALECERGLSGESRQDDDGVRTRRARQQVREVPPLRDGALEIGSDGQATQAPRREDRYRSTVFDA
jgi:hypothetical protein